MATCEARDKWSPYCEICKSLMFNQKAGQQLTCLTKPTAIRIVYASGFGFQCCSALLLSRLEAIAATRYVSLTSSAKRRRTAIELGVGFVLPIIYVGLAVINQGHRYDIIEKFGPVISIYPSVLSIIFSTAPVLIASVVGTTYAGKSLNYTHHTRRNRNIFTHVWFIHFSSKVLCSYWLFMRRRQLSAVLSSSGSGINVSQYVRLFGLSCVEILWTVPVNWTIQMQNLFNRDEGGSVLFPYSSWADVHYGFGRVNLYSIDQLQMTAVGRRNLPILYLGSLSTAVSCLLFFGFLGTSTDISRDVHSRIKKCLKKFIPTTRFRDQERLVVDFI